MMLGTYVDCMVPPKFYDIDDYYFFPLFFLSMFSNARKTSASELLLSIILNFVTFLHFFEQATFSSPNT